MKFAVIGDIHGNKFALEAVIEDINSKDVDFIVSTGDLVGYMPYPNEVINILRKNRVVVVQGNHDEFIANSEKITTEVINNMTPIEIESNASAAFTNWVITDENRSYLKNLTTKLNLQVDALKITVVHGSPRDISEYLYHDEESLAKISEVINEDIVICGHTHIPYFSEVNNKYFINAGSVGKPKHGDSQSTYTIVEIKDEVVNCSIEKVKYSVEEMIKAIEENNMISNSLIAMLTKGK